MPRSEDDFPRCSCGHTFEDHQYPEDEHSSRSGMMSECHYIHEGKDCACKSYDGLTSYFMQLEQARADLKEATQQEKSV